MRKGKQRGKPFLVNPLIYGTPGRIRTYDLRIRSPLLYPAELQAHKIYLREMILI